MKRILRKDYDRLQKLNADICAKLEDPARQSMEIWRGDMRAIQWAAWWIREVLKSDVGAAAPSEASHK